MIFTSKHRKKIAKTHWLLVPIVFALFGSSPIAMADILCKKKNGILFVRTACKPKETPIDPVAFGLTGPQGLQGPQGPTGPTGAQGPAGPSGASNGYATGFSTPTALPEDGTFIPLMTLNVPAGSYVSTVRLQGITVTDPDGPPGNNYRYDCTFSGGGQFFDDQTPRVGTTAGVESYLTWTGAATVDGPITFGCRAGNGHPLQVLTGSMTAVKVDTLN
jgi:hypothetical protein